MNHDTINTSAANTSAANTSTNEFSFNAARFDSTASNRIKSLADYLNVRRVAGLSGTQEQVRQAALDSLVAIASRKGVDMNSVKLFKAALSMPQEYISKVMSESRGADLEAVDNQAAKQILADMSKKIALEAAGFTVEWKA